MLRRLAKFLLGLALIPACWGATLGLYQSVLVNQPFLKTQWPFLAGLMAYCVIFSIFQSPIRTYVFGHELSHAVWVWIFRGRVKGFAVSKSGGKVETNKSNFLIALAPYFFPVYSILVILLYGIGCAFWPLQPYFKWVAFFLGASWAFHVVMTVYAIGADQEEVRETGVTFSLAMIYFLNILVLGVLMAFASPTLRMEDFLNSLMNQIVAQYRMLFRITFG